MPTKTWFIKKCKKTIDYVICKKRRSKHIKPIFNGFQDLALNWVKRLRCIG